MDKKQREYYDQHRKRGKQISIRCTEEESEKIKSCAAKANMNLTQYIIESATKEKIVIYDMSPVLQMNLEINKIGNNINQIAHKANTYDLVQKGDIDCIKKQLRDLEEEYRKFLKKMVEMER